jgi:hypothetical protein
MKALRREVSEKNSEIRSELLYNLDEFRALHRYFPELLSAFMEDEYIGKVLTSKAWLLDFKQPQPQVAAAKLEQLRAWRMQLRQARESLRGRGATVQTGPLVSAYPILSAHLKGSMDRNDVLHVIEELDSALRKEGWLTLISDSLIMIPLAKFMNKAMRLRGEELEAKAECLRVRNRGSIAETRAQRELERIAAERRHYESVVSQLLLANPDFLAGLKKKKSWLSKGKSDTLVRFAQGITPHRIRERAWLDEMRKRIKDIK